MNRRIRPDPESLDAVRREEGFWGFLLPFLFFGFIDFPPSLVAETRTLPYTIPSGLSRPDPKPSSP